MKIMYWSRKPGNFVNKNNGEEFGIFIDGKRADTGPKFVGSVREWYETLVETLYDCAAGMKEAKVYTSADIGVILESTVFYRPNFDKNVSYDGKISNFEIYVDNRMSQNEMKIVAGTDVRKIIVKDMNIS